jgi:hypothetical protein
MVRVDFALIPDDPLFGAVISASQAITDEFCYNRFSPHISLARLDRDDQAEAAAIARRALSRALAARSRALDLCDIGKHSERWDILASLPATGNLPGHEASLS